MYVILEYNNPFAIVENNTNMRIEKAIAEEYLYESVSLIGDLILPDWGERKTLEFVAEDENGDEVTNELEIIKLVKY